MPLLSLFIPIADISIECCLRPMSCGSANLRDPRSLHDIRSGECPSRCMGTDQLVLRHQVGADMSVYLRVLLYLFVESHDVKEFLQTFVVVGDVSLVRSFVVILLQDRIGSLSINAHSVNVNLRTMSCLLLHYREGVMREARLVNAHHIRMPLTEIAREDKHVLYLLKNSLPLRSSFDVAKVKMVDVADIIWSE